jgi:hypothetical protein
MTNLTNASLATQFALVHAEVEAAKAKLESIRTQILEQGMERIDGDHCYVLVSLSERSTVDAKAARRELSSEQLLLAAKTFDADIIRELAGDKVGSIIKTKLCESVLLRHTEG